MAASSSINYGNAPSGVFSGLSTSYVAGLIALGIFITNVIFNLAWPLVAISFVKKEENAITWTVIARTLQNSYWPTILRSDASATIGVPYKISFASNFVLIGTILLSVASVMTPLGLYETIEASSKPQKVMFQYVQDNFTALGLGTAPRIPNSFNRFCGSDRTSSGIINCPDSYNIKSTKSQKTSSISYDNSIPSNYADFWSTGVSKSNRSISALWDIEWRTYTNTTESIGNVSIRDGAGYLAGSYRPMDSVILDHGYKLIEGLIIDTKTGGVGFRNHTAPIGLFQYGATWQEDILFIEPVTECINMNISFQFNLGTSADLGMANLSIKDHGGFADFDKHYTVIADVGSETPDLKLRAYNGAWTALYNTMLYLNITSPKFSYINSKKGKDISIDMPSNSDSNSSMLSTGIYIGNYARYFVNMPEGPSSDFTTNAKLNPIPNPFNISRGNFWSSRFSCQGATPDNSANITNISGQCGLVMGIPQPVNGDDSSVFMPKALYSAPFYSCASANKATIKTVDFTFNGTSDLMGLTVRNISDKYYPSPKQFPIWAVENTKYNLGQLVPLWGLVDKHDPNQENVSYRQSDSLWLTGVITNLENGGDFGDFIQRENLPAVDFPVFALHTAYEINSVKSWSRIADYTATRNLPMYNLWRKLTKTTHGTSKMVNLIWTDIAANAVVGTKSWNSNSSSEPVPVMVYNRVVKYHIPYAIPAFLVLFIISVVLVYMIITLVTSQTSIKLLKTYLAKLSAGRIMTGLLNQDALINKSTSSLESLKSNSKDSGVNITIASIKSTNKWSKRDGQIKIDIGNEVPRIVTSNLEQIGNDLDDTSPMIENS